MLIHHSKYIQSVTLDFFNRIAIEREILQLGKQIKLSDFFEILDVVSVKLKCLEVLELQDFFVNFYEVIVGEVDPLEAIRFPEYVFCQCIVHVFQIPKAVIIKKQSINMQYHFLLPRSLFATFLLLATSHNSVLG